MYQSDNGETLFCSKCHLPVVVIKGLTVDTAYCKRCKITEYKVGDKWVDEKEYKFLAQEFNS